MAPEHESAFGAIGPIWHFWTTERHSKRVEFSCIGLWPNGLQVTIMHTLFDLFTINTLIVCAYFLESSDFYK